MSVFASFQEWCMLNKRWIKLGVDFALQHNVMKQVLWNINSPYRVWVTVKRNLIKYSKLQTTTHSCCTGHMLLRDLPTSEEGEKRLESCTVCIERGLKTRIGIFEYIPLRPRIENWLQDESSCRVLFDDLQTALNTRKIVHQVNDQKYEEFIDGTIFRRIADIHGGEDAVKWDIFIDISTDGFDVFRHSEYHCWPIIAMIHNLPLSRRFLMRNAVPLGFVKGPDEPARLDTFLYPLVEEIRSINANGGTAFKFYDGNVRKVRVHVLWIKGDGTASCKVGGFVGAKGKHMCRFCDIEGHKCSHCRSYYFPSSIRVCEANETNGRRRNLRKYDPGDLPIRDQREIASKFQQLANANTKHKRNRLRTETGIEMRTVLYEIPTLVPFESFPLDVMHIVMNLTNDLVTLWKGELGGRWGSHLESEFVID